MSFKKIPDFRDDFYGTQLKVSSKEINFIDELLEQMMDSDSEISGRAEKYHQKIMNEFGIDLGTKSFDTTLSLPIGVAPGTYSKNLYQIEKLIEIGFPFIGLKTIACQSKDGSSTVAEWFRGSVWNPDKEIFNWPIFLTGERGAEYTPEEFIKKVLSPGLKIAQEENILLIPSICGPAPIDGKEKEWLDTVEMILEAGKINEIAIDFPPYFTQFMDLSKDIKELSQYFSFLNDAVQEVFILLNKKFGKQVKIIPKINSAMLECLKVIINGLRKNSNDNIARFIGFNREFGDYVNPLTLETVPTGFGGPTALLKNLRFFHLLDNDEEIKYEATYSGGIISGKDVVSAFASANITKVEMISTFYFNGVRASYKRILGGFTVCMIHLSRTEGINSVKDLIGKWKQEKYKKIFENRLKTKRKKFIAIIDGEKCSSCQQKLPGYKERQCLAKDICPGFAFEPVYLENKIIHWQINPDKCLGCGACIPKVYRGCPHEAISIREQK